MVLDALVHDHRLRLRLPNVLWHRAVSLPRALTATVIQGAFVAIFLFKFLMPRPLVRFSSKCLVNGDRLAFRLVRESSYQPRWRNCKIEVRCRTISRAAVDEPTRRIDHDQRSADSLLNATLQWVAIKNDTMGGMPGRCTTTSMPTRRSTSTCRRPGSSIR